MTTLGDRPLAVLTASATSTGFDGRDGAQDHFAALSSDHIHRTIDSTHSGPLEDAGPAAKVGPRHHGGHRLGQNRPPCRHPMTRDTPSGRSRHSVAWTVASLPATDQGPHPGHMAGVNDDLCLHAREADPGALVLAASPLTFEAVTGPPIRSVSPTTTEEHS